MQAFVCLGVLATISFGISLAELSDQESKAIDQVCFAESGITQEDLNKAFIKHFKLAEDNPKINKFAGCIWRKHGYISDEGVPMLDNLSTLIENSFTHSFDNEEEKDEKAKKAASQTIKICAAIGGSDADLTAVRVRNCILDHIVKFGKKGYTLISKKSLL